MTDKDFMLLEQLRKAFEEKAETFRNRKYFVKMPTEARQAYRSGYDAGAAVIAEWAKETLSELIDQLETEEGEKP